MLLPHIVIPVALILMILPQLLLTMSKPQKRFAKMDDRTLFQTHVFHSRFSRMVFILCFVSPLVFAQAIWLVRNTPGKVFEGMISIFLLAMVIMTSMAFCCWHFAGMAKAEIDLRRFQKEKNNGS